MGVPLNLQDIQTGFLSSASFNENNTLVEEALAKTLNRTSNASGNAMEVDLDMGLNKIFNVSTDPSDSSSLLTVSDGDARYLNTDGDSLTGDINANGFNITNLGIPSNANDAARLADVGPDSAATLRTELSSAPSTGQGATLVNGATIYADSVAALKAIPASVGQNIKTLGYYTPGDGGGNDYEVVAAATGTDDGGSFIDLNNGLQAKGLFAGSINVKTFGARADGSDDYLPIQAVFDYVTSQQKVINSDDANTSPLSRPAGAASKSDVFFPSGKYRITASVGLVSAVAGANNIRVIGENSYLYTSDRTIDLLSLGTYNTEVSGMVFDGGARHIRYMGQRIESGTMVIERCQFRNAKVRCISLDRADSTTQPTSGFPAQLRISKVKSYGCGFLVAHCNGVTIRDSWLAWDTSATEWDGGPLIIANDKLNLTDVLEVPYNTNTERYPRIQNPNDAGLSNVLSVNLKGVRFGGEATQTPIFEFLSNGCDFIAASCAFFGVAGSFWGMLHELPKSVLVENCVGNGFVDSYGLWFNSANITDISDVQEMSKITLDLGTRNPLPYTMVLGSDRLVNTGIPFQWIPEQEKRNAPSLADTVLENHAIGDGITFWTAPYAVSASGASTFGGTRSVLGYTLGYFPISTSSSWAHVTKMPSYTAPSEGVYTFSCVVECPNGVVASLLLGGKYLHRQRLAGGINHFTARFYHDGATGLDIELTLTGVGANTETVALGLFAVHKGTMASRWQSPGHPVSAMSREFYGAAAPTTGTWRQGDRVYDTTPSASGAIGWVCVTAGSPGTWKTFGAISA